ncbi:XRE family transcriptional regulator [Streptomyces hygroscopicus]|uniref:helix-turn-helix domain-containing protein n=1 Tax=Streptomyces hygroscopicus TaxID=1912 RepID=UPI00076751B8|nr:XRE family transcriptional regulator [Streptomyces hygroscopicus]
MTRAEPEGGSARGDSNRERLADLGTRIRDYRRMRRLTLRRVADAAGITESYLSQIERGTATGSVDVLSRIATALALSLSDLFSGEPPRHTALRRADRPEITSEGVRKYLFTRRPLLHLEVMEAVLDGGALIGDAQHVHGSSQELVIVLEGSVVCTVEGDRHPLDEGDSIEYTSSQPHSVENPGTERARILYVISPPSI